MGLTMHSPGGIPGTSSAVTWNHTAAERQYGAGLDLLTPLAVTGVTALSLTHVGRAARILGSVGRGVLVHGTKARTWAAYNLYKEYGDLKHWLGGGEMQWGLGIRARPITTMYFPHPMVYPFPWVSLNPVEGSSSLTAQQNGGPSAPPPLVVPKPSRPATPGAGSPIPKPPSTGKGGSRRGRCPPGHRWNGRRCVKIR